VIGGFQGAVIGGVGGGIISTAAIAGANGLAVNTAASLVTMPADLAADIAISNTINE
jgi:hypothetical protein